ncbi:MAG: hypothetical protein FD187_3219, partial [bacterium]
FWKKRHHAFEDVNGTAYVGTLPFPVPAPLMLAPARPPQVDPYAAAQQMMGSYSQMVAASRGPAPRQQYQPSFGGYTGYAQGSAGHPSMPGANTYTSAANRGGRGRGSGQGGQGQRGSGGAGGSGPASLAPGYGGPSTAGGWGQGWTSAPASLATSTTDAYGQGQGYGVHPPQLAMGVYGSPLMVPAYNPSTSSSAQAVAPSTATTSVDVGQHGTPQPNVASATGSSSAASASFDAAAAGGTPVGASDSRTSQGSASGSDRAGSRTGSRKRPSNRAAAPRLPAPLLTPVEILAQTKAPSPSVESLTYYTTSAEAASNFFGRAIGPSVDVSGSVSSTREAPEELPAKRPPPPMLVTSELENMCAAVHDTRLPTSNEHTMY